MNSKDVEKQVIKVDVRVKTVSIKLSNEDGIFLSELEIRELKGKLKTRPCDLSVKASLGVLHIKDLQRRNSPVHFNTFLRSIDETGLFNLEFLYYNINSPLCQDSDVVLKVHLGKTEVN